MMYFKTNGTEELIGELLFVDQSTISRVISDLEDGHHRRQYNRCW
jgi:hypothetical protein